ncbi:MAG TPA: hypothetical protein ENN12_04590 [Epsilonproteobacteria bacterium]|nr:hypothetical protein [Campylobacterota bacterium]
MTKGDRCFVEQEANEGILMRVTNVCSECYTFLPNGDTIYYDMQTCRYLCQKCKDELVDSMDENCNIVHKKGGLF